jgi:hypothetical protein
VALYRLHEPGDLESPSVVVALDGWVDAGSAATAAAEQIRGHGDILATFDPDQLFDYRSRRPTLQIVDGRPAELTWPDLTLTRHRIEGRDLLVLTGAEPDFRWHELAGAAVELCRRLGVSQWLSLGAIPAVVPHTRPVPVLGTASRPELLRGDVQAGPEGLLRVPAAAISVLDLAVAEAGVPAVGYFAQVPHYLSGPYPAAAIELLKAVGRHLGVELPSGVLPREARALRARLDAATASDEATRSHVEKLEALADEEGLPAGNELIADIERFLREGGSDGGRS